MSHHEVSLQVSSGLGSVLGLSAIMFLGAYGAALLPSFVRFTNPRHMALINAGGAGLLLGAALCVVLPEGFFTFAEAQVAYPDEEQYPQSMASLALLLGFFSMVGLQLVAETWSTSPRHSDHLGHHDCTKGASSSAAETAPVTIVASSSSASSSTASLRSASAGVLPVSGLPAVADIVHRHVVTIPEDEESREEMLLLLPAGSGQGLHGEECKQSGIAGARRSNLGGERQNNNDDCEHKGLGAEEQALYGLVVHAAADGLAVGAACLSGNLALSSSVGAAILIHKFPVSFGLASYLKGSGWEGWKLQRGLLTFCLASPLLAILTFLFLGHIISLSDARNVALCILFSGGTVLHAGMVHVLPPVLDAVVLRPGKRSAHDAGHHGGHCGVSHAHERLQNNEESHHKLTGLRPKSTSDGLWGLAVLLGCSFIPLLISAIIPEAT
ncbi:hypothetical protein CEUSTIGMA_g4574.t1 [Chlamydomonas eustigma]|uniref:Zinc/iron permease n=1 Tax=Chlamydomonas eustigma TaxID=1157962 RepID=A0A250X232_9CHLO|nr:hypothetical protein CEUSTIGMA_g4574.t1 [Chlamydomonas eustigma]|eukprot:GAX77128.1 hypothetical protein CEUSTIGMA_g4574.t1 [Chlamydomonas eustigma]